MPKSDHFATDLVTNVKILTILLPCLKVFKGRILIFYLNSIDQISKNLRDLSKVRIPICSQHNIQCENKQFLVIFYYLKLVKFRLKNYQKQIRLA